MEEQESKPSTIKDHQSGDKNDQPYTHLTQQDRDRLQALLDTGVKPAEIARILGRDKSTIGREITRNKRIRGEIKVTNKQQYEATSAEQKAQNRRRLASYDGKKIEEHTELRAYVIWGLEHHWNPDEIAGTLKNHRDCRDQECTNKAHGVPYVSKTTIYEWLYSEWGQAYTQYLYTKRHTPKKRLPKAERQMIPDRVSVGERPAEATNRSVYNHHEADTMVSGKKTQSKAALATDIERKSRFVSARKIPNLRPQSFNEAMRQIQDQFMTTASLTLDNGLENKHHTELHLPTFFCDPYSSWQKGGIEHANKMIRRYLPKGMDLADVSLEQLQTIVTTINNKPRKILGYKSALQVAQEHGLLRETATRPNQC
jgi:IS30 family transposase